MYKIFTGILCTRQRCIHKLLLTMKLTAFIIMIAILQVSAASFAQKVTFNKKNASLEQVLKEIHKQTGYNIFWSATKIGSAKIVNVDLKNAPLVEALDKIFEGQPFTYDIDDKNVTVKEKEPSILDKFTRKIRAALNIRSSISGRVTDSLGQPVIGASVSIKGTSFATITDNNGIFSLGNLPPGRYGLVITYIGYSRLDLTVEIEDNGANLNLVMHPATSSLDQVQIIAYGETTQRYNVGSVSSVTAKEIEQQPVQNILLALQGRVPGLVISPTSGAPGAAARVQIRGQNSLAATPYQVKPYDQPLFIVDGVPMPSQNVNVNLLNSMGGSLNFSNYGGISPFNSINPADIESVSILRDADATSIYGTQGANGVILITTKKGKAGPTNVDVAVNTGINTVASQVQMLNTQQYLQLRREALKNDNIDLATANPADYPDLLLFDQNKNTNWYDKLENNSSTTNDAHVSISGGSAATTYLVSGGYTRTGYNFPGDFADNRLTLHTAFHNSSPNNRFTIDFGTDYSYDHNNSTGALFATAGILTPPNYPDLTDRAGNLVWYYKGVSLSQYQTEANLKQPYNLQTYNLNNTLRLGYQIFSGLKFSINAGYSRIGSDENSQTPLASQNPQAFPYASSIFATNVSQTINIEPQFDYKRYIGKGELTVLAGGTYKKNINNTTTINAGNYTNDALLGSISAAASITGSSNNLIYKYAAVYGRLGYIYDQKYIISLTGRRDGSSNFGPGRQFGNFGSIGLGWIFSEETAFKSALPFISYGKLSGNYGTTGSDGAAPYNFQSFWQPVPFGGNPFQGVKPFVPVNLYNPDYSWDTKKSLNIAADLGLWNNRVLINVTLYQDRTSDQLTNYTLPSQTGFTSVLQNINATIQNRGIEITLNSNNIEGKNFKWSTSFNFSANRNTLAGFPGLDSSPYATSYFLGRSVNTVNGFKYKDVNPQTGVYEFYTASGGTTYTPSFYTIGSQGGDMGPIANPDPVFTGGFGNTITYKNIGLFFLFQFQKQTGLNYLHAIYSQGYLPGNMVNEPLAILNRWQKPGDISNTERASVGGFSNGGFLFTQAMTGAANFQNSSGAYSDASYIKLRTVALSYSLPPSFLKKLSMKNARFFVNAQNLLTITGYKVGDPELPGSLFNFPLQRTIVCGFSTNF